MTPRRALIALVGIALAGTALTSTAPAPAATAAPTAASTPLTTSPPIGHWADARPITSNLHSFNAGDGRQVTGISCPAPGDCTAAGTYIDAAGHNQVFVVSQVNGTWGKATQIPDLDAFNAGGLAYVDSLSCSAPGDCVAGGTYRDSQGNAHPYVAESKKGTWTTPVGFSFAPDPVVATSSSQFAVDSVSCTSPGNCTATLDVPGPMHEIFGHVPPGIAWDVYFSSEINGTWHEPTRPQFIYAANEHGQAIAFSVSCWSPGNCLAGGYYSNLDGSQTAFIASQSGGTWDNGQPLPGLTSLAGYSAKEDSSVYTLSCPSAEGCAASGWYGDTSGNSQALVADESAGNWSTQAVPGSADLNQGGNVTFPSVSCDQAKDCGYSAGYREATNNDSAFVATENQNGWQAARPVFGLEDKQSLGTAGLSCGGAGSCLTGGSYQADASGTRQAFIKEEYGGNWGIALPIAGNLAAGKFSGVGAVSCASIGNCVAGGFFSDSRGHSQAFVADESTITSTRLSLSAGKVAFGKEQAERLTVSVIPRTGGTPTGTVTVSAGMAILCKARLAGGKAHCTLAPRKLPPGTYRLTASYSGDQVYSGSLSGRHALTVTAKPTTA